MSSRQMKPENLRKLLNQYPFLWSIESGWPYSWTRITVRRADVAAFRDQIKGLWYLYLRDQYGYPTLVTPQDYLANSSVAEAIRRSIDEYAKFWGSPVVLELVASRVWSPPDSGRSTITIFRPPLGRSFRDILE